MVQIAERSARKTFLDIEIDHQLTRTANELDIFLERTHDAHQIIGQAKAEWEELVNQAKQELERANRRVPSQLSVAMGTLGPMNPFTPRPSFEYLESLGRGTYGEVSKVRETSTGTLYAQKVIRITDPRSRARVEAEVASEVSIMQRLRHLHIASVQFHVREENEFSIIMLPVAECDLHWFLMRCTETRYPKHSLVFLTSWFGCLVSALAFAHAQQVKHEDIKPTNILIKDHQPYLSDFGCAKDFSHLDSSTSMATLTFGTPVYWPPEPPPNRGRKADVFSLGCVFTEMYTVRQHRSLDDYRAARYVSNHENGYAFRENLSGVAQWLSELLDSDDDEVGQLLVGQIIHMIEPDYDKRKSARDIKRGLRGEGDTVFCSICF
jgi:serine/threonine protein kinase